MDRVIAAIGRGFLAGRFAGATIARPVFARLRATRALSAHSRQLGVARAPLRRFDFTSCSLPHTHRQSHDALPFKPRDVCRTTIQRPTTAPVMSVSTPRRRGPTILPSSVTAPPGGQLSPHTASTRASGMAMLRGRAGGALAPGGGSPRRRSAPAPVRWSTSPHTARAGEHRRYRAQRCRERRQSRRMVSREHPPGERRGVAGPVAHRAVARQPDRVGQPAPRPAARRACRGRRARNEREHLLRIAHDCGRIVPQRPWFRPLPRCPPLACYRRHRRLLPRCVFSPPPCPTHPADAPDTAARPLPRRCVTPPGPAQRAPARRQARRAPASASRRST